MTEMRERRFFCFSTHTNPTGTALHGVLIALILLRGLGGRGGRFGVLENMRCWSLFVVCWTRINSGIALLRPSRLVTSHYIEGLARWAGRKEVAVLVFIRLSRYPRSFRGRGSGLHGLA